MAVALIIRPIDKAFESIGLNFDKGFGKPHWLPFEKYPLKSDVIRINSAGYTAEDFKAHTGHIASRLKQPIKDIRKPSVNHSVIEVTLKRSSIPSTVKFEDLPFDKLGQGEFFVGISDDGLEKLSLSKMIHGLVAGLTGKGKTQFLRQFIATILVRTRYSHVCLVDMKGGIDFQNFHELSNFEMATDYPKAQELFKKIVALYEERRDYLNKKKRQHWTDFSTSDLARDEAWKGKPIGPVVIVVDELAELSKKATGDDRAKELQEQLSTLARLARVTSINLILGTQRPSKEIVSGASKDNLQFRLCYSLPSVTASTLVVGDMSATTLGNHPGRAIYQLDTTKIVQTPLLENSKLDQLLAPLIERQKQKGSGRSLLRRQIELPLVPDEIARSK